MFADIPSLRSDPTEYVYRKVVISKQTLDEMRGDIIDGRRYLHIVFSGTK